jgi:hypothetical protein
MGGINAFDILFVIRTCEDNYGNTPQIRVLLNLFQYPEVIFLVQVQVQKDNIRTLRFVITIPVREIGHCFFLVPGYCQRTGETAFFDRFPDQPDISRIIFYQKNTE